MAAPARPVQRDHPGLAPDGGPREAWLAWPALRDAVGQAPVLLGALGRPGAPGDALLAAPGGAASRPALAAPAPDRTWPRPSAPTGFLACSSGGRWGCSRLGPYPPSSPLPP